MAACPARCGEEAAPGGQMSPRSSSTDTTCSSSAAPMSASRMACHNRRHVKQGLLESLYRQRATLETIFRIVDLNNFGFITMEGFRQMWELLSAYLKMEITDEAISDLSITIDTNREGNTDEFKEAFLLTDNKSRLDRVTSWGPPLT
nr:serine/threonine-protein phosphatase with EF-hands 2-like isoform X2 [Oncorhynchus gorbuscha]